MNYQEMLDAADYNRSKAKNEASRKRYTSDLPPPKKNPKSNVQSENIRKFLEKKKAEEQAKIAEEQKRKEKLLELRSQNSKSNKKAKIMASRTKDNDFSRIKLTEDEVQSKKKIETELQKKHLSDKVKRMKARIELEEKEKLLPRKRKRKSKHDDGGELADEPHFKEDCPREDSKHSSKHKDKLHKQARPPPPPAMSFSELLKVAEVKQHEPILIPKKVKEEEKLMTKKQRRLEEQERDRLRRKIEREGVPKSEVPKHLPSPFKQANKQSLSNGKSKGKLPDKHGTPCMAKSFLMPKSDAPVNKHVPATKSVEKSSKISSSGQSKESSKPFTNHDRQASSKSSNTSQRSQTNAKTKENKSVLNPKRPVNFARPFHSNGDVETVTVPKATPVVSVDTDAIAAAIEKRIREKIEKEIEEKLVQKFGTNLLSGSKPNPMKANQPIASHSAANGKRPPDPSFSKRPPEKLKSGPPVKKPFHPNPYLDPPRKRLEPIRPQKPVKRRIEDDSDDDDDDMSDFIDDGPSQNDEDYSKYIQEIFGYDRNRYVDDDDDDIAETSFAEQMKEETRSARLGYLEDLEEEKKLRDMEMKRKKKKLKK